MQTLRFTSSSPIEQTGFDQSISQPAREFGGNLALGRKFGPSREFGSGREFGPWRSSGVELIGCVQPYFGFISFLPGNPIKGLIITLTDPPNPSPMKPESEIRMLIPSESGIYPGIIRSQRYCRRRGPLKREGRDPHRQRRSKPESEQIFDVFSPGNLQRRDRNLDDPRDSLSFHAVSDRLPLSE